MPDRVEPDAVEEEAPDREHESVNECGGRKVSTQTKRLREELRRKRQERDVRQEHRVQEQQGTVDLPDVDEHRV